MNQYKDLKWEDAHKWTDKANELKEECSEPRWSWDCNFRLDFDGPLVKVSSRFYPPNNSGEKDYWEGEIDIAIWGDELITYNLKSTNLDNLKILAEERVNVLKKKLIAFLSNIDKVKCIKKNCDGYVEEKKMGWTVENEKYDDTMPPHYKTHTVYLPSYQCKKCFCGWKKKEQSAINQETPDSLHEQAGLLINSQTAPKSSNKSN